MNIRANISPITKYSRVEMVVSLEMKTGLRVEEKAKQFPEKVITKEKHNRKTTPNGMPVYDMNEPWVQQYIDDFGTDPSFF